MCPCMKVHVSVMVPTRQSRNIAAWQCCSAVALKKHEHLLSVAPNAAACKSRIKVIHNLEGFS